MQLEREVEREYRPQMLAALQRKVDAVAAEVGSSAPDCPQCGRPMGHHDTRPATWLAHWGRLPVAAPRCQRERRPLLEVLGVESGRICGSLARLLALLATVAPYELAARLADLLLGVTVSAMGVWRVTQRLGQAAASYSEALSQYHADSRSEGCARRECAARGGVGSGRLLCGNASAPQAATPDRRGKATSPSPHGTRAVSRRQNRGSLAA